LLLSLLSLLSLLLLLRCFCYFPSDAFFAALAAVATSLLPFSRYDTSVDTSLLSHLHYCASFAALLLVNTRGTKEKKNEKHEIKESRETRETR
jgi:hypothetical protein